VIVVQNNREFPKDGARTVKRTVVIGAGGYSGAELTALLLSHGEASVVGLFGSEARAGVAPQRFDDVFPRWRGLTDLSIQPTSLDRVLDLEPEAVFLATPHEVSHELVPALLAQGIVAFDLSAAFRLSDSADYPKHYGFSHKHAELLASAVYGLPERFREQLREAMLIALPGCYPTSIVLPLAALNDDAAIDPQQPVIVDSTSGVSGAGRSPALKSMFCEVTYQPYGVLSHRHTPEIELHSGCAVIFTPHLGPFDRGIVSTIHVRLAPAWNETSVRKTLAAVYGDEPFVRLLPRGVWPSVGAVRGTNFCDIGLAVDENRRHLIVVSAIDNLLKGAAGQAVQCFNERFGLPATTGLPGGVACILS
jgi:N-acetyl-gamma-glutamyl-phosphate reductase